MCWCSKAWPTLNFTVEKPKTYSQTSSVPLCRQTSPPLWIHREQAYVSETPPKWILVLLWNDIKLIADSKVILAIRRAEHLRRLVYVACNAKAAMNNFIEWVPYSLLWMLFNRLDLIKCKFISSLCRAPSNRVHGTPFRPVRAMAVDLFPQTMHMEMLLLLERVDYNSQEQQPSSAQEETLVAEPAQ